jgi:hypothetical protein
MQWTVSHQIAAEHSHKHQDVLLNDFKDADRTSHLLVASNKTSHTLIEPQYVAKSGSLKALATSAAFSLHIAWYNALHRHTISYGVHV